MDALSGFALFFHQLQETSIWCSTHQLWSICIMWLKKNDLVMLAKAPNIIQTPWRWWKTESLQAAAALQWPLTQLSQSEKGQIRSFPKVSNPQSIWLSPVQTAKQVKGVYWAFANSIRRKAELPLCVSTVQWNLTHSRNRGILVQRHKHEMNISALVSFLPLWRISYFYRYFFSSSTVLKPEHHCGTWEG